MKKYFRMKLGLMLVMLAGAMSCGSPKNISRVSLLSERQINASAHYELKALARTGTGATIQEAVAAVVKQAPGGLFIQNAEISYLKKKKIKITGDIWGLVDSNVRTRPIPPSVVSPAMPVIAVGDKVRFVTARGIQRTGKVVGFRENLAIVEVMGRRNLRLYVALPVKTLTKY